MFGLVELDGGMEEGGVGLGLGSCYPCFFLIGLILDYILKISVSMYYAWKCLKCFCGIG